MGMEFMSQVHSKAVALLVTIMLIPAASAEELVREFIGDGNRITSEFEVDGPWLLDWRVNSDYATFMSVDIVLLDGRTGFEVGRIKHKKEASDGVRLFQTGGSYKLRVDAIHTRWQLKVIELTPADAARYKPNQK